MSEWKLKECCLSISDGDHLPPPKANSGSPFITISNIDSTNHLDFKNLALYTFCVCIMQTVKLNEKFGW